MTKFSITTLCLLLSLGTFAQKPSTLKIKIDDWKNDTIILVKYIWGSEDEFRDTTIAKNGEITLHFNSHDTLSLIATSHNSTYHRPGRRTNGIRDAASILTTIAPDMNISFSGTLSNDKITYTATGSDYHTQQAQLHNKLINYYYTTDSINQLIGLAQTNKLTYEQESKLFDQRNANNDKRRAIQADYIRQNPNTLLAANLLQSIDYKDVIELYSTVPATYRNGLFKTQIDESYNTAKEYIAVQDAKQNIVTSKPAPDFFLPDKDGNLHSLSSFRGKWVVIDFWGSWCGPCIGGMPKMKAAHSKYKDKIEFIGIACNDKESSWLAAIEKHQLPWINLIEKNNSPTSINVKYAVEAYPRKFIITPKGTIKHIFQGEGADFYTTLSELFE